MGWEKLQNGLLLAEAGRHFEVFLTVDKRMKFQQELNSLPIKVIVLDSILTTPEALKPFAPHIEAVLPTLQVGSMVEIDASGNVTIVAAGGSRSR